jgi:hypothetical protein
VGVYIIVQTEMDLDRGVMESMDGWEETEHL